MVSSCPRAQTEIKTASQRLGCKNDTYGNSQYMCLPNEEKSSLVEFCFEGEMGIELKGSCLEVYGGKQINRYSCSRFSQGCPDTDFYKYNIHKYPSCLEINTERRCYVAEPHCSDQISEGGIWPGIGIGVAILIIALTIIAVVKCIIRRRKSNRKKAKTNEANPDKTALLKKDQPKHPAPSTESGHGDLETAPRLENVAGCISFSHNQHGRLNIIEPGHKLKSFAATMDKVDMKFQEPVISPLAEHPSPTITEVEETAILNRSGNKELTIAERSERISDREQDTTDLLKSKNIAQTIPIISENEEKAIAEFPEDLIQITMLGTKGAYQLICKEEGGKGNDSPVQTRTGDEIEIEMAGRKYTYSPLGKTGNDSPVKTPKRDMQFSKTKTSETEDKIPY